MRKLFLAVIIALPFGVFAKPVFNQITKDQFEDISKGMAANFTHNSMMGASKLGTIFGFQVGVVGAQTAVPDIHDIAKAQGGELKNLYNAGAMAAVGIPFGLSFEAVMMPTFKSDSASGKSNSFGVKLNINEVIPVLPVNLALRGIYSNSEFSFKQTVSNTTMKVENSTTVSGVQLLFSPMLPIIEPYVGVGYLSAENTLESTGATSIFQSGFSSAMKEKKTMTGTQVLAGLEVSLLLIKIGAEYSQAFDNSRYGVKLSFGF